MGKKTQVYRRLSTHARAMGAFYISFSVLAAVAPTAKGQTAASFPYSYSGRITEASGAPKSGVVDLAATFWSTETAGTQIGPAFEFANVSLTQGVFAITFALTPAQVDAIFGDGSESVYIQIASSGVTYPRQKFSFVPFALRVPIDKKTLAFDATSGQLGISGAKSAANNAVLASDGNGGVKWVAANLSGTTGSNVSVSTGTGLTGGPITTTGTISLANTSVTAGSYTRANISVDAQGRITAAQSAAAISDADIAAGANIAQSKIAGLSASLASREGTIASGTTADYFRGDKTWQPLTTASVPESGTALYYSDVRVRASLSGTAPVSYSVTTGAISMAQANASTNGYLSSSDWGAFNGKQNALGFTPVNKAGDTMSGALDMGSQRIANLAPPTAAADAATKGYTDAKLGGRTLDVGTPSNGQVVKWDQTNQKFYLDADQVGVTGGGIASINSLSTASQSLTTSTSGNTFGVASAGSTHTISIPLASVSGVTSGLISNSEYQSFINKVSNVAQGTGIAVSTASGTATVSLATTGTPGTYAKVTTDTYGRITTGSTLSASDIPPLNASAITSGAIAVANGGTGATSLAANNVILGNGTSPVQTVAPGASGNVLTSTGTGWQSSTLPTAVTSVSGTAPISVASGTTTPIVSISQANATTNGYLGSSDWNTFNNKQAAGNYITTLSGDLTTSGFSNGTATATLASVATAGTATKVTYDAKGRVTTGTTLSASDLPPISAASISSGALSVANGGTGLTTAPANGQIPIGNGSSYTLGTITAGTGINISNAAGAITVSATADASTKVGKAGDAMTGTLTLPANGLVAGTNQLVLAGGNVGIGTSNPQGTLSISGSSDPSDKLALYQPSNNVFGIQTLLDAQNLSGYSYGSTSNVLSLQPLAGWVGIGTTAPNFALDVVNNEFNAIRATGSSSNSIGIYVGNSVTNGRQWGLLASGGGPAPVGAFTIFDDSAHTPRMVIDSSGNSGFGTAWPTAKVHAESSVTNGSASDALYANTTVTVNASGTNWGAGIETNLTPIISSGVTNYAEMYSIIVRGNRSAAADKGTLNRIFGEWLSYGHGDSTPRTTNNTLGLAIYPLHSGGTIGTDISLLIGNATGTVMPTTYYGLYQQDTAAKNYFAGNVGIGTIAPASLLHVNGTLRVTDGTQGNGKTLVSNANGDASWSPRSNYVVATGNSGAQTCVGNGSWALNPFNNTVTITTTGKPVRVEAQVRQYKSGACTRGYLTLRIDGDLKTDPGGYGMGGSYECNSTAFLMSYLPLAAGTHTIELMVKADSGVSVCTYGTFDYLMATELY